MLFRYLASGIMCLLAISMMVQGPTVVADDGCDEGLRQDYYECKADCANSWPPPGGWYCECLQFCWEDYAMPSGCWEFTGGANPPNTATPPECL